MNESNVTVALEDGADALYLRDLVWLDSSSKFVTICSFLLDSLCRRSQHLILQDCYMCEIILCVKETRYSDRCTGALFFFDNVRSFFKLGTLGKSRSRSRPHPASRNMATGNVMSVTTHASGRLE